MRVFHGLISVAAMLAVSFCSVAQSVPSYKMQERYSHPDKLLGSGPYASYQQSFFGAKTTAGAGSRLIAMGYRTYDGTSYYAADSLVFHYSGGRGGHLIDASWQWLYDDRVYYSLTGGVYKNLQREVEAFDANNNVISSVSQLWDSVSGSWQDHARMTITYNSMNMMQLAIRQTWETIPGAWVNDARYTYTYDGANNLLVEIGEVWNSTAMTWDSNSKYTMSYDASNNLTGLLFYQWHTSGVWVNAWRQANTYDAGNNMTENLSEIIDSVGIWHNTGKSIFSGFISRQPSVQITQVWDGTTFVNSKRNNATYNVFDQPENWATQSWDAAISAWVLRTYDYAVRYYYETYANSVQNVGGVAADVSVYPVPATDVLSIDVKWKEKQAFSVTITDMQGHIYSRYTIPACTIYTDKISVAGLAPGNYLVSVTGIAGEVVRKIIVAR